MSNDTQTHIRVLSDRPWSVPEYRAIAQRALCGEPMPHSSFSFIHVERFRADVIAALSIRLCVACLREFDRVTGEKNG